MKKLRQFDFVQSSRSRYDWPKLLDGSIYQLESGKDFKCKPATLVALAARKAQGLGLRLKTAKVDGGLVIQADKLAKAVSNSKDSEPHKAQEVPPSPPIRKDGQEGNKSVLAYPASPNKQ
jgi:hypothetical protein